MAIVIFLMSQDDYVNEAARRKASPVGQVTLLYGLPGVLQVTF